MRRFLSTVRRRIRTLRPRPLILMYHRIAAPEIDPWGLAVHPDRFEAHLRVLQMRRTPMTMTDLVRRFRDGTLPGDAVALTFDDGYVDNLVEAQPRLAAGDVPATLFVAAGAIGQGREFWWDEVARGILGRREALDVEVAVDGHACRIAFAAGEDDRQWRAWQEPRSERQRVYLDFWGRLRAARPAEREAAMARFREVASTPPADTCDLPMTANELEQIAREGTFELGGHTLSHAVLPLLEPEERRHEILEGKRRCEELAGRPIAGFAYPHGAVNDDVSRAVRDSGFSWGCTTAAGFVTASCDVFALPRLCVQNWDADTFEKALA